MKILNIAVVIGSLLVSLLASAPARAEAAELDGVFDTKWAFYPGYEFPGAKGASRLETVDGRNAAVLEYDFTNGGAYVMTGVPVAIAESVRSVQFDLKADRDLKIVVRLEDSSKQTHQFPLRYDKPDEWQTFLIDLTLPAKKSFGGANDGVYHFPLVKIWIGVGKGDTSLNPGQVAISKVSIAE